MKNIGRNPLLPFAIIVFAIGAFLFFSLYGITQLGLSTDECVFVNSAITNGKPEYIYMKLFSIPFMTFMYEGALKAWLYMPIFKIFGVSVYSIRIPAVLIATITLVIWFRSSQYIFKNRIYPYLFLLFIATDPAYIHHTNIEYNTVAIHTLLISLMFLFYIRMTHSHSLKDLSLLLAMIVLGTYNRFNFAWIAFGLGVAGSLFNFQDIKAMYQSYSKYYILIASLFLIALGSLITILLLPATHYPVGGEMSDMLTYSRLSYMTTIYWQTMAGNFPYITLFRQEIPFIELKNVIELGVTLLAFIVGIIAWLLNYNEKTFCTVRRYQLFFISIMVVTFFFIVITPPARTSYHLLTIWPLQHLVFLISIFMLTNIMSGKLRNMTLLIAAIGVVSPQLFANYYYAESLMDENTNVNSLWTPVIYELQAYIEEHAHEYDEIVSLNFGFLFQLIALTPNDATRLKLHEETWSLLLRNPTWIGIRNMFAPQYKRDEQSNWDWLYNTYFKGKKVLLIRAPSMNSDTEARNFPEFAEKYHLRVQDVATIFDKHQYPVFFLYSSEGG